MIELVVFLGAIITVSAIVGFTVVGLGATIVWLLVRWISGYHPRVSRQGSHRAHD